MATFQRDESGNWIITESKPKTNSFLYLLATLSLLSLASLTLLKPALANTTNSKTPAVTPQKGTPPTPTKKLIAPKYGSIKLGAFAGEAANLAGLTYISTTGLANKKDYAKYRESIRSTYGADLEDMNYFSLAPEKLDHRLTNLKAWILLAGEYGDVTLALEPLGKEKYDVFFDKAVMTRLAAIFKVANKRGITIWVRFASESNLRGSEYRAIDRPDKFYSAAENFKSLMPQNVKLVYSPLINTYIAGHQNQRLLAKKMLYGPHNENKIWDCIGGTIYRTDQPLLPMYNTYYEDMRSLAPQTPFQICEVGAPYSRKAELLRFLDSCSRGTYPKLRKVNLFARNINQRADPNAEFGYLNPTARTEKTQQAIKTGKPQKLESFIKPILEASR